MKCNIEVIENKMLYKAALYVVFAILLIITISNKADMFMDEVYSYGLANHVYSGTGPSRMEPIEGVTYSPAENAYLEYMTAQEDGRFNYKNVWKNQSNDVHPPLYYALLHTICSLFPGTYSAWYAGVINIIFALLTLWAVRKLVEILIGDNRVKAIISLSFIATAGILDSFAQFRMYVMAMFWVTLLAYLFVKGIRDAYTKGWYLAVFLVSVCGALTHYYVIVWLFFLSCFWGGYMLYNRQWKSLLAFCADMLLAGGITIAIFPAMLIHIFGVKNYSPTTVDMLDFSFFEYIIRLIKFCRMIDLDIFAGTLIYILIAILFCTLIFLKYHISFRKDMKTVITNLGKKGKDKEQFFCWFLLIISCICYFILVGRIAKYNLERYMYPIYAICFVIGACCIWYIVITLSKKVYCLQVFGMVMLMLVINSWIVCTWNNLYLSGKESIETAKEYSDKECFFVYPEGKGNYLHSSFYEIRNYDEITFITEENLELLDNLSVKDKLDFVVYITKNCDEESVLKTILNTCHLVDEYEQISDYESAYGYYLQ